MAGFAIAGKSGRVDYFGTRLNLDKWKVTLHGVDIPTTNFEDVLVLAGQMQTFTSGITGPLEGDLEFNGFYDLNQLPFAAPPVDFFPGLKNLTTGPYGLGVQLYPRRGTVAGGGILLAGPASSFSFTNGIRILQSAVDCDVNGRVNVALVAKSNGAFTTPTAQ
jgi:hypothetical protein